MTDHSKARLNRLTSGVPTLDAILGGGFPEYSFNLMRVIRARARQR